MEFNRTYTLINQVIIIYTFVYIEILLFILYSINYLSKMYIILLSVIVIYMLSTLIYALYVNNDLINSTIGTQLGTGRLLLSLISVHVLLKSTELKIQKSENTLLLALLLYSILGITIYAFSEFFVHNKEYGIYFYLINAFSNLLFYVLISMSFFQAKNQYSKDKILHF